MWQEEAVHLGVICFKMLLRSETWHPDYHCDLLDFFAILPDYLLGDVVDKLKEGSQANARVTLENAKLLSVSLLS